jgi:hypothetical protein
MLTAFLRGINIGQRTEAPGNQSSSCPRRLPGSELWWVGLFFVKGQDQNAFSFILQDDPEGAFVPPEFDLTGNTFEVSTSKW